MQKLLKYAIFRTKWGYFGLAGTDCVLWGTCLPLLKPEKVTSYLQKKLSLLNRELRPKFDKNLFKTLQEQITAYFEGVRIDFGRDIPIVLDGLSSFSSLVLMACRNIKFGRRITYSALAEELGRPRAARAVGNALAKNPLPLIIPCHRVIRSDGKIGGFSTAGGKNLKAKLLKHEQATLNFCER